MEAEALASLWEAVDQGDVLAAAMAVKVCKELDVSVDEERKSDGVTPLAVAVKRLDLGIVKLLLKQQGVVADRTLADGSTILWMAAKAGASEIVKLIAEVAPAAVERPKRTTGASPLIAACRSGHLDTVLTLIELGASPSARAADGSDSLYVAAQGNHVKILDHLVSKGADIEAKQKNGATALFIASQKVG